LDYRAQLERAVDMNMNMIRVWGGGLYETEAFYRATDELGILIWQDFAYGCSMNPDTGEWLDVAKVETEVNVKRLMNHPSLAHWCGNNENLMFWDYGYGQAEHPEVRYYGENIYDKVIPDVLKELDPSRSYTPSSPWGGKKSNDDQAGDQHNWSVWHGGDWPQYVNSKGRFISEFGFACSPAMATWRKWIAPEDWAHDSPVARWHDKTGKGYETFQGYVKNHYPESVTLEDWMYYSQLNQRDALRHGIEHYRRSEFCQGTLIWQINDCWPVQSWALIDSEGHWKAAAFELRRLFADELVTISRDGSKVFVHVVADGRSEFRGETSCELFAVHALTGEVLKEWSATVSPGPTGRKLALEADVEGLPTPETILYAVWGGVYQAWKLLGEPKDARLALPPLTCRIAEDGTLEVVSDLPVVDLLLTTPADPDALVENFVTMPMGGVARLSVTASFTLKGLAARSLAGVHEVRIANGPI
jgi:beta-mannosidase